MGRTSANAAAPITGTRTLRISSVAYAEEDRLSEANTASAVGLPSRSCARRAEDRALQRVPRARGQRVASLPDRRALLLDRGHLASPSRHPYSRRRGVR